MERMSVKILARGIYKKLIISLVFIFLASVVAHAQPDKVRQAVSEDTINITEETDRAESKSHDSDDTFMESKDIVYDFTQEKGLYDTSPTTAADEEDKIYLDADTVTYTDSTGIATASKDVVVRNKQMTLHSPYVEYKTSDGIIEAYSDPDHQVVIITPTERMQGNHLTYNVITKRGVLTDATGNMGAMFMVGKNVRLMPVRDAISEGVIKKRKPKKGEESVAEWLDVKSTTCDFKNPHYRLVSKKVILFPGKKIIMKKPKFYLGKTKLFPYPFDYIISLKKRDQSIMPFFLYDNSKGMGGGIRGVFDLDRWGEVNIAGIAWTQGMWEAKVGYQKELFDRFWIYAESNRFYNKDDEETMWRPRWGMRYTTKSGWRAELYQSQRELIENEMRPGQKKRYNVWRDPEFKLQSPSYALIKSWLNFNMMAVYGRYQDNLGETIKPWINRWGLTATLSGAPDIDFWIFKPYYGASYTYFDYENKEQTQRVTDGWVGLRWKIGAFNFDSMFFKRWVDGRTLLAWDAYSDNENFYQTVSFPLPFGASWEKWDLSVRCGYDCITNEVATMRYSLNYIKHCMTWQFWMQDDIAGKEKTMGLTFFINAFPEYKIGIGSDSLGGGKTDGF